MGRATDDGEVSGSQVIQHPLPPRWHQEGEDDDDQELRKTISSQTLLPGPTRVGKTRPA